MRELQDGSIVEVDGILRALKAFNVENDIFAVPNRRPDGPRRSGRRDDACWSCEHGRGSSSPSAQ